MKPNSYSRCFLSIVCLIVLHPFHSQEKGGIHHPETYGIYYEMISHAVYSNNGIVYSNNGMYPPQKSSNIHKILKTYWKTGTIEAYQLKPAIKEMLFHTPYYTCSQRNPINNPLSLEENLKLNKKPV